MKKRKYTIKLIPVKSHKKVLFYCLCDKDSKSCPKSFGKARKIVFAIAKASVYFNAYQYSGAIKVSKKFRYPINR